MVCMKSNGWKWAFLGVLCWALISTGFLGYYYKSYRNTANLYVQTQSKLDQALSDLAELQSLYNQVLSNLEETESLYNQTLSELEKYTVLVNICIDYGNGTVVWYNDTRVPLGATLFNATSEVAVLNYTVWNLPGYGYPDDKAIFIDAINGVWNDYQANKYWQWYYWDGSQWVLGPVGCNHPDATVEDGGIYMWRYETVSW